MTSVRVTVKACRHEELIWSKVARCSGRDIWSRPPSSDLLDELHFQPDLEEDILPTRSQGASDGTYLVCKPLSPSFTRQAPPLYTRLLMPSLQPQFAADTIVLQDSVQLYECRAEVVPFLSRPDMYRATCESGIHWVRKGWLYESTHLHKDPEVDSGRKPPPSLAFSMSRLGRVPVRIRLRLP